MSNIIKSGFVAFADDKKLVIDSNKIGNELHAGKVIRSVDDKSDDIDDLELEDILSDESLAGMAYKQNRAYADVIIHDARTQADKLLDEARAEAAHTLAQAKEEGYQAGYLDGKEQAKKEAEAALTKDEQKLLAEYEQQKKQLLADKELFLQEAEPKMAEIMAHLVTHLTGVVVEGQQQVLTYMIDCAMRDIEDSLNFVIKVSEADYEYVSAHQKQIYGASNPSVSIEIFADAKLTKNQCLIETDNGIVNCSLDEQLTNLTRDIRLLGGLQ